METGSESFHTSSAIFHTSSADETREFGRALGALLGPGSLVAFVGELGSGKTVAIQGVSAGLGYEGYVSSPSFVIVNEYEGAGAPIYHVDLYRVSAADALHEIGYREIFFGDGVALVEWADRASELLPPERLEIRIAIEGRNGRELAVTALGEDMTSLLERLAALWKERDPHARPHD